MNTHDRETRKGSRPCLVFPLLPDTETLDAKDTTRESTPGSTVLEHLLRGLADRKDTTDS